jgi:hypothetical protein
MAAEILGPKLQPNTRAIVANRPAAVDKLFQNTSHYVTVTAQYSAADGPVKLKVDRGAAQELVRALVDKNGQLRDQTLSVADWRRFVRRCTDGRGVHGYNNNGFGEITAGEMKLLKLVETKAKDRRFSVEIAGVKIDVGSSARTQILVDVPSIRGKHAAKARWG